MSKPDKLLVDEYMKLRWEMNRFNDISPDFPHSLDACFYFTKHPEFQAQRFAQKMALLLDKVFDQQHKQLYTGTPAEAAHECASND